MTLDERFDALVASLASAGFALPVGVLPADAAVTVSPVVPSMVRVLTDADAAADLAGTERPAPTYVAEVAPSDANPLGLAAVADAQTADKVAE